MTENPTPNRADIALDDLRALEAAAQNPLVLGRPEAPDVYAVVIPDGYRIEDLAPALREQLPRPARPRSYLSLDTEDSFIAYALRFAPDYPEATIRMSRKGESGSLGRAEVVFDDHLPGDGTRAGWQQFGAFWSLALAPEYLRWREKSGVMMEQVEFARFLEENIEDIEDGATLLGIAMTMQARTNTEAKSAIRLDNGQIQFVYAESIDAKAGPNGKVTIPATFTLNLRVLRGAKAGYRVVARLRYRIGGNGLRLWYDINRLADLEDLARDEVAGRLAEATQIPVFRTA